MSEKLDRMKTQKEKAEQKLRYYQHQEKMLEHRIPELTRKARTHRSLHPRRDAGELPNLPRRANR